MPSVALSAYRRQVLLLMAVYTAMMLLEWPLVRTPGTAIPWRVLLALAPTVPVIAVLWVAARRMMRSDELEQRIHLVALSVATGIVCALTLVIGFLCAGGVLALGGDALVFVFPALCLLYAGARWRVARRYGTAARE